LSSLFSLDAPSSFFLIIKKLHFPSLPPAVTVVLVVVYVVVVAVAVVVVVV
jgi:hypothetical protein